jgi:hypothetical protein
MFLYKTYTDTERLPYTKETRACQSRFVFGRRGYFRDMVYGEIFNSPPKIQDQGFPDFFTIA